MFSQMFNRLYSYFVLNSFPSTYTNQKYYHIAHYHLIIKSVGVLLCRLQDWGQMFEGRDGKERILNPSFCLKPSLAPGFRAFFLALPNVPVCR